jgi:hypothetical protein
MRIRQAIIPAILALSTAGSILVGSVVPAVAAQASSTVAVAAASTGAHSWMFYHD